MAAAGQAGRVNDMIGAAKVQLSNDPEARSDAAVEYEKGGSKRNKLISCINISCNHAMQWMKQVMHADNGKSDSNIGLFDGTSDTFEIFVGATDRVYNEASGLSLNPDFIETGNIRDCVQRSLSTGYVPRDIRCDEGQKSG